jgi:hemolysin III
MESTDPASVAPEGVSPSVRRALTLPRPRWRGTMHRTAIPLTITAGVVLVLHGSGPSDRVGAGVFVLGALFMFTASGLVHLRRWSVPVYETLFRVDHAAIFVFIAASATPVAITGLEGTSGRILFWALSAGALLGVLVRVLPFHPPKGLMNTLYLSLGWVPIFVAPALITQLDVAVLVLIAVEGLLYTTGALMLGARWPDFAPRHFGYHEVWHTVVTTAVGVHFVAVWLILGT